MSHFIPGKVVKEFTTKKGKSAQLIYPKWEVVDQLLMYINALSAEDTYVSFSGEQLNLKEEASFLANVFVQMELAQAIYLFCLVDGKVVGICGIEPVPEFRHRSKHVGAFGLSIAKEYRGEGLGYELANQTLLEAAQFIKDLEIVILTCFANNIPALTLYEKLGFVKTGQTLKMLQWHDQYIDQVQMAYAVSDQAK